MWKQTTINALTAEVSGHYEAFDPATVRQAI